MINVLSVNPPSISLRATVLIQYFQDIKSGQNSPAQLRCNQKSARNGMERSPGDHKLKTFTMLSLPSAIQAFAQTLRLSL